MNTAIPDFVANHPGPAVEGRMHTEHRDQPSAPGLVDGARPSPRPAPGAAAARAAAQPSGTVGTGASVWLCVPGPGEPDPDIPRWATGLVGEYSIAGRPVEVRAAAVYPGLAGEVAAVLAAASASGRDAVGVLPTPGLAARTRTLLGAFGEPHPPRTSTTAASRRPAVVIDRHDPPTVGSVGSVGLLVVLAGPVRPGASAPALAAGAGEALAGWVRGLAPGATLVLVCPPETARDRSHPGVGSAALREAAERVGLRYTQHLVLVLAPVAADTLTPPQFDGARSGPFHPVHTDAFVFTAPTPHHAERA